MRIPDRKAEKNKKISEAIITAIFLTLVIDSKLQIQEAKKNTKHEKQKKNAKNCTAKHIIFNWRKIKDKGNILKEAREKKQTLVLLKDKN